MKILVIGNSGVGKTSVLKRLIYKNFSETYKATIGVDFGFYKVTLDNGEQCRMLMYDLCGQERNNILVRSYYKDAVGALVVGDLTSPILKEDLKAWKQSVDTKVCFPNTTETIPCYMICNKSDLQNEYKDEDLQQICKDLGFQKYYRTSALTGENLEVMAADMAKLIYGMLKEKGVGQEKEDDQLIKVEEPVENKKGCC